MLHRRRIVVLRRRDFSPLSGCDTLSVFGYRAECACEWKGGVRKTFAAARSDFAEHRLHVT